MATFPYKLSRSFTQRSQSSDGEDLSRAAQTMKGFDKFRDEVRKHLPFASDLSTIESIIDGITHLNSIDDRKLLLEHTLVYLSNNSEHPAAQKLQTELIKLLYEDLPHPPETIIGPTYAYREADGGNNNPSIPDLGKAGTPYSRSVQQIHPLPRNELPDAGLVFDTLLRREKFVPHPAGLSSLMFAFAALVIHTVFRTSHKDVHINETSSYVDLAPLYGNDQKTQDKIRVRDGRGLLHPDTFAEDRLLLLPPAVCVLLTLFNRNHNYIAKKLLELNERGTYVDPNTIPADDPQRAAKLVAQEEDIFQTTRLINCAWFAGIVMSDYFCAILGLVRQGSSWAFNPFEEMRNADHSLFERGRGNACSVEFNCLYRWHATTSKADEEWVAQMGEKYFQGRPVESLTIQDFRNLAKKVQATEPDLSHWTIGSLQRDPKSGQFSDEGLAGVLIAATEEPAGAFRARGTPHCMRLHEIMGIEQNRQWGVCSLNDFRKFLGLKTYSSFLEWNPDPEIASAAEKLYGHIDRLELYVGLQAEEAKPVVEGAGLCPSYTISRAILSDAIALTRGDRFYTADYTPFNMTAWGFADCQRDPLAPGCGSMLGRLLLRTLPEQYAPDSTYAWFPLMTPPAMERILTKLGQVKLYSLEKPRKVAEPPVLAGYEDAKNVLKDEKDFGPGFGERVQAILKGDGFFIACNDPAQAARYQRELLGALTGAPDAESGIKTFFYEKTRELIQRESCQSVGTSTHTVDLVRDVLKLVPIYWAAELAGIRLKTSADSEGDYTPSELFDILADTYSYLFLDVEPAKLHNLRINTAQNLEKLSTIICRQLGGSRLSIMNLFGSMFGKPSKSERTSFTERLRALGYDADTQTNATLALLVGATVELSQAAVNVVNFYLDPSKPSDVQTLVSKSPLLDAKDEATLQGFVLEALRLDPTFRGVYREVLHDVKVSQGTLKAKTRVFVDVSAANISSHIFTDPKDVNPARGFHKYLVIDGAGKCLGLDLSSKMIVQMVRAVYSFKGASRAPGRSGTLKRYKESFSRTSSWSYLGPDSLLQPWATSMLFQASP
ncbi:heme peroxidase [Dichomitus squalens]|uniref:Heme peroxidase n=1 Tax=Dichomitus squalens TaxID=114155 RepID=A0A4Q9MV57_9APHY|nr:heme peroxidase [Dichomitus squalens]TBU60544.1 heme peroxidase [Dichomitus squalens]